MNRKLVQSKGSNNFINVNFLIEITELQFCNMHLGNLGEENIAILCIIFGHFSEV